MSIINKFVTSASKEEIGSIVACLDSSTARKRAYIGLIALNALRSYLDVKGIEIDDQNNCYNNPLILNEFDVADIRLKNNIKIDVRAIVGDKYPQMWIPRDHKEYDLIPDIYVGAKIDKKLNRAELMGFMVSSEVNFSNRNDKYFIVDAGLLRPMTDLYSAINTICPRRSVYDMEIHNSARELFLPYIDNSISGTSKEFLIKHLSNCENCRKDFYELYRLNTGIKGIKSENLAYYLNLKDYEHNFRGLMPDSTPQAQSSDEDDSVKSEGKTRKFDFFGGLKNLFGKKSPDVKPLYIGLSGIIQPEFVEVEEETLEMMGVEEALDLIYEPKISHSESIDFQQIVENLKIKDLSAKQELANLENNYLTEELPALAQESPVPEENQKNSGKYIKGLGKFVQIAEKTESDNDEVFADFIEFDLQAYQNKELDYTTLNEEDLTENLQTDSSELCEIEASEDITPNKEELIRNLRLNLSKLCEPEVTAVLNEEELFINSELGLPEVGGVEELEGTALNEEDSTENPELGLPELGEVEELDYTLLDEDEFFQLDDVDFQGDISLKGTEELFDDKENDYTEITEDEFLDLDNKNLFKDLAIKIQDTNTDATPDKELIRSISEQYNLNEITEKPRLLKSALDATKVISKQYDLLKEQEGKREIEANTIENMLSQLDDIEIIDSTEAVQTLTVKPNYESNNMLKSDAAKNKDEKSNLIKAAAVLTAAGILTCGSLMISDYINHNKAVSNNTLANAPQQSSNVPQSQSAFSNQALPAPANASNSPSAVSDGTSNAPPPSATDQGQLAQSQYSVSKNRNVSDVLASAFVNQGNEIKITNISWEVGISLANDPAFKNYLMVTGQALKAALSKELLKANEIASNDTVKVDVNLDLNGNINTLNIQSSSGSKQIDKIVLQTLKEIFSYTKLPRMQTSRKDIDASVIINL